METIPASSGVAGAIADIENRRLETRKNAGMTLARSAALHRLRELLDHETEALRLRGPASAHLANVEAVRAETRRMKGLSAVMQKDPTRKTTGRSGAREPDANAGHRYQPTKEDRI